MPRRSILLAAERQSLLAISDLKDDLIQHYTLSDIDLSLIQQCRGAHNRLGFAIQLCYMRHPGLVLASDSTPFLPLLQWVADQLKIPVDAWHLYAQRAETRREHLLVLQSTFGFVPFKTQLHHAVAVQQLQALAAQTDKGIVLATALVDLLRRQHILLPTGRFTPR
jgi:TnpA family transposase